MKLYTDDLLAHITESARGGVVAWLCTAPADSSAGLLVRLIEAWCDLLAPGRKTVADLKSADDSSFWAGLWELTMARAFLDLGFSVDMKPRVNGLTPDLVVEKDGIRAMVEVLTMGDDEATRTEQGHLDALAGELQSRLSMPTTGLLARSAQQPVAQPLPDVDVEWMSHVIQQWVDAGCVTPLELDKVPMPVRGYWTPDEEMPFEVAISASARTLGQARRIGQRIAQKIERYAPLVTDDLKLMVAIGARSFKITSNQVVEALQGGQVATFDVEQPGDFSLAFDGRGAVVPLGPVAAANAANLAGTWRCAVMQWDEVRGGMLLSAEYIHNPYSQFPIPLDFFAPLPEMQPANGGMGWVRENEQKLILREALDNSPEEPPVL